MNKYTVITIRIFLFLTVIIVLYFYYPLGNKIFSTLVNIKWNNSSETVAAVHHIGRSADQSSDLLIYAIQLGLFFICFFALPGAFLFYMWQLVKKVKFHSSQTQKAGRSSRRREGSIIVGVDEKLLLNAYNQLQHIEAAMDAKLIKIKDEIVAELREELHIIFDKKVQAEQCLGKTRILYKSGQYAEALRECNSAVELSPSGVAHYIRGVLHHKLGLDEAAMVDLKTAAKLSYQKAQAFLATQNVSYQ